MNVFAAPPELHREALEILFRQTSLDVRESSIEETLQGARDGSFTLDGLLIAVDDGSIIGVVLYLMQPDKTAFLWPPMCADFVQSPIAVEDKLLAELTTRIQKEHAWIGQCIIEPHEIESRQTLTRNGYPTVTELDFMNLDLSACDASVSDNSRLTSVEFSADTYSRFAQVLESTYVETLDCPLLSDHRSVDQAIASHQTSGQFDPTRWKVYCSDGKDVGVLLLSEYPEQEAWEVVYMGVAPEARGHGYGREIIEAGIRDAVQQGTNGLFLAVDNKNHVAQGVYQAVGFESVTTRAVHGRFFVESSTDPLA